jgi:hypothetical protein
LQRGQATRRTVSRSSRSRSSRDVVVPSLVSPGLPVGCGSACGLALLTLSFWWDSRRFCVRRGAPRATSPGRRGSFMSGRPSWVFPERLARAGVGLGPRFPPRCGELEAAGSRRRPVPVDGVEEQLPGRAGRQPGRHVHQLLGCPGQRDEFRRRQHAPRDAASSSRTPLGCHALSRVVRRTRAMHSPSLCAPRRTAGVMIASIVTDECRALAGTVRADSPRARSRRIAALVLVPVLWPARRLQSGLARHGIPGASRRRFLPTRPGRSRFLSRAAPVVHAALDGENLRSLREHRLPAQRTPRVGARELGYGRSAWSR